MNVIHNKTSNFSILNMISSYCTSKKSIKETKRPRLMENSVSYPKFPKGLEPPNLFRTFAEKMNSDPHN